MNRLNKRAARAIRIDHVSIRFLDAPVHLQCWSTAGWYMASGGGTVGTLDGREQYNSEDDIQPAAKHQVVRCCLCLHFAAFGSAATDAAAAAAAALQAIN